jgi:hypothetical protein
MQPALTAVPHSSSCRLGERSDPGSLYVPPTILNEAEAARHAVIWTERQKAIQKGQYKRDTELANEPYRLGTFRPHFLHDPDDGGFPISTDVGKLITIGTAIHGDLVKPPT